jgi:uncharacterized protein (TIGR02266 family)
MNYQRRQTMISGHLEGSREKRHAGRQKIRMAVFYGHNEYNLMSNYAINLSSGGIFIETNKVLPQNEQLIVEFMLPNKDYIVSCKSRVAWTNEPHRRRSPELPPGMGIQFVDLPMEEASHIRGFLDNGDLVPVW